MKVWTSCWSGAEKGKKFMITSTSNTQVKNIIQLQKTTKARRKQGLFVVEGWKMCTEMPREWLQAVYASEDFLENIQKETRKEYEERGIFNPVARHVFLHMSDTKTPQGILAVGRQPVYTLEEIAGGSGAPMIAALEDVQDPGNVGTILRTAEAAGAAGVLLSRHSADLFNPKTVRATMGAIYRLPFLYVEDLAETIQELKQGGYTVYAAKMQGQFYDEKDYTKKTVFLIGNEGNGLTAQMQKAADEPVCIPMAGKTESLNASVAAGILMYEAARQRRRK